jgi:hypothetical protein
VDKKNRLVLADLSGGRNGADPPLSPSFAPNQVVDAVNGDWYRTTGFRKRYGSSNTSMTGSNITGVVTTMARHVPATNDADAELWAMDDASAPTIFARLVNSTTWANPGSVIDSTTFSANRYDVTWASLNGLLFISLPTAVDRLHCWDAVSNAVRRTGVSPGGSGPTVSDTGAGTYAAVGRYYRVRWAAPTVNSTTRRSEATPPSFFVPSGTGTAARVARPITPSSELITQWYVEASADGVTFYVISGLTAVGTLFIDDTNSTASYSAGTFAVSPLTGTFTLQKAYRLIAADQNRLVGWGSWTSTDKQNRMEFSAVVGALDQGDAERVDTTTNYFLDFDENDSGPPIALVGPVWDKFYAFKSRQMYELAPTGSVDQPYRRVKISGTLGCVGSHAACAGEDSQGNPCLYVMTHRGVFRYGQAGYSSGGYSAGGLRYIGRGIEDLILGPTSVMNMAATKVISHMVYHADLRQLWCWFATGASNDPDTLVVLDVRANQGQGAWSRFTGSLATARCSVMFANSIGASMGFQLVPYVGQSSANNRVIKAVDTTVTQDAGTNFQATITTKPLEVPGYNMATGDMEVLAPAASGVTLTATCTPDFGANPAQTGTALLTAAGSETRVTARFGGSALGGSNNIQITVGDASAVSNAWSFDRIIVPTQQQEPRTS